MNTLHINITEEPLILQNPRMPRCASENSIRDTLSVVRRPAREHPRREERRSIEWRHAFHVRVNIDTAKTGQYLHPGDIHRATPSAITAVSVIQAAMLKTEAINARVIPQEILPPRVT
jgi:hypothetical protein